MADRPNFGAEYCYCPIIRAPYYPVIGLGLHCRGGHRGTSHRRGGGARREGAWGHGGYPRTGGKSKGRHPEPL